MQMFMDLLYQTFNLKEKPKSEDNKVNNTFRKIWSSMYVYGIIN